MRRTASALAVLVVLVALACTGEDEGSGGTSADGSGPADAAAAEDVQGGGDQKTPTDPGEGPAPDATLADSLDGEAQPPDVWLQDTAKCEYVCALDCVCKKDEHGCDMPECVSEECTDLLEAAGAALEAAAAGCTEPLGCTIFNYPYCGSFGCFMGPVSTAADLSSLLSAVEAADEAGCPGFTCGCEPPPGQPLCLSGQCRMCPGDCGDSCPDLEAAVTALAGKAAAGCTKASDCTVTPSPVCFLGPQIQCHAIAHLTAYTADLVLDVLEAYTAPAMECPWAACDCQYTQASCVDGACVPVAGVPEPCAGLDKAACQAKDGCTAYSGLPAPAGCGGAGAPVYAGCAYTASAGACDATPACAQNAVTGQKLLFPESCFPGGWQKVPWDLCCPSPCAGLDKISCQAAQGCSAFSGLPLPGGCEGKGSPVFAGCEYTANAGACGEAETCAEDVLTGERLVFPTTCHPADWATLPWEECCPGP